MMGRLFLPFLSHSSPHYHHHSSGSKYKLNINTTRCNNANHLRYYYWPPEQSGRDFVSKFLFLFIYILYCCIMSSCRLHYEGKSHRQMGQMTERWRNKYIRMCSSSSSSWWNDEIVAAAFSFSFTHVGLVDDWLEFFSSSGGPPHLTLCAILFFFLCFRRSFPPPPPSKGW